MGDSGVPIEIPYYVYDEIEVLAHPKPNVVCRAFISPIRGVPLPLVFSLINHQYFPLMPLKYV